MIKLKYHKGARAERELVSLLQSLGFLALRTPRSGGRTQPLPDVIAIKKGNIFFFECKNFAGKISLKKEQIENLIKNAEKAGAFPLIAIKTKEGFKFIGARDLKKRYINKEDIEKECFGIEFFQKF